MAKDAASLSATAHVGVEPVESGGRSRIARALAGAARNIRSLFRRMHPNPHSAEESGPPIERRAAESGDIMISCQLVTLAAR